MSDTKFTKGEWLVEQCDLPITESEYFNINAVSGGCIADTYDKYDANLISAAPDMYRMLELLRSVLLKVGNGESRETREIEQLLAKARGE